MRRLAKTVVAVALVALAFGPPASPAGAAPASDLRPPRPGRSELNAVPGELVVVFKDAGVSRASRAAAHAAAGASVVAHGTGSARRYDLVRVDPARPGAAERSYAKRADVAFVQPNYRYDAAAIPNDPLFGDQWGLHNTGQAAGVADADIDAPEAWASSLGTGTVVAVVDTGVDLAHPDLGANVWHNAAEVAGNGIDDDGNGFVDDVTGWDFADADNDPTDDDGHGSHVAGVIAAVTDNAEGVAGVAPQARVMPLRFMGANGGDTFGAIRAVAYATDMGADIINASWGGPDADLALKQAIEQSGLPFVAAAGNDARNMDNGLAPPFYPAAFDSPNIISVAASTRTDTLASFSNWGAKSVDVAAPGSVIMSSVPFTPVFIDYLTSLGNWNTGTYLTAPWTGVSSPKWSAPYAAAHLGYANNEKSYLTLATPLDLSAGAAYDVTLHTWVNTREASDKLSLQFSHDGVVWDEVYTRGGPFAAWAFDPPVDLSAYAGDSTVWARIGLEADASTDNTSTAAGVAVDDFVVWRNHAYEMMSGSSMAAPHVSGVAALVLAVNPSLSAADVKSVIMSSADAKPGFSGLVASGARLNAARAVAAAATKVPTPAVSRVAGSDRYAGAVAAARLTNVAWVGVSDVVIASGEDRAAADPLAAAGLSWAYRGAPLMLVSSTSVSTDVEQALREIATANPSLTVHFVGGTTSVPDARRSEIVTALGPLAGKVHFDRVAGSDRYANAAAIAARMRAVRPSEVSSVALVANGADSATFFDALALSPIAARTGSPILLVTASSVPGATSGELAARHAPRVIVGGGPRTVSATVVNGLGAERWSGVSRYDTAVAVASNAVAQGWLTPRATGVASKLPDALAGGSVVGSHGGPLLLTAPTALSAPTAGWLSARKAEVGQVWVFGGSASVSDRVMTQIGSALAP